MSIYLEPYDHKWKVEFDSLKAVLITALKGCEMDIQHIGSTAIPGMLAKPVLDIDIIINDKDCLGELNARLKELGYESKGEQGIPGRYAFRQTSDLTPDIGSNYKWQKHHLYVCFSDSPALKNHLLFRDLLLKNKRLAREYTRLKERLVAEVGITKEQYTIKKTEFITNILSTNGVDPWEINEIRRANSQ
jgi:GrpB-like predicted nucleotidyltransferase (UPF0157 family)